MARADLFNFIQTEKIMRQTYTGQIYLPERGGIGRIYADIVIEERHRDEMAITSHPVEQGATITDHAYKKPSSIIIRGGVTDSKAMRNGLATVGTVQNTLDRPPLSPRDFYEKLLQLQAKREPFDICTLWRLYRNLLVKSLSVASDPNSENCLTFTAECQEVQIVQNAFANSQNHYATIPAPPERHLFKHTEPLLERGLLKLMPYLNGTGTWTAEGQARARQVDISRLPNVHVGSGLPKEIDPQKYTLEELHLLMMQASNLGLSLGGLSRRDFLGNVYRRAPELLFSVESTPRSLLPEKIQPYADLLFDGEWLYWRQEGRNASWPAYSGKEQFWRNKLFGVEYQKMKDEGPIPEGRYNVPQARFQVLPVNDIEQKNKSLVGRGTWPGWHKSWGAQRVWLEPMPETDRYGRDGFSIHGGTEPGSAGCIDLVERMPYFAYKFLCYRQDMMLEVIYVG